MLKTDVAVHFAIVQAWSFLLDPCLSELSGFQASHCVIKKNKTHFPIKHTHTHKVKSKRKDVEYSARSLWTASELNPSLLCLNTQHHFFF